MADEPQGAQDADEPTRGLADEVTRLNRAVVKGVEQQITPFGLITMEFSILKAFLDKDEWTVTQLADLLPTDAPRISRLVTRLVEGGLLRRRRRTDDRRVVLLKLTQRGQERAAELAQRVNEFESGLLAGVSAAEVETLRNVTARIVANRAAMDEAGGDADTD